MNAETWQHVCQIILLASAIAGTVSGYGIYHFGKVQARDEAAQTAFVGTLTPADKVVMSVRDRVYPALEFGDSGSRLLYGGNQNEPILKTLGGSGIYIKLRDGKALFSTTLKDRSGKVLAEIVDNEWKVKESAVWDRNYSSDALEVINDQGDVVFQAKVVGNAVQLQVKMYDAGVALGQGFTDDGKPCGKVEWLYPDKPEFEMKFDRKFKYPSSLHLGELAK